MAKKKSATKKSTMKNPVEKKNPNENKEVLALLRKREKAFRLQEIALVEVKINLQKQDKVFAKKVKALGDQISTQIIQERKRITIGMIISQEPGGYYQVQIGQRQVRVKSAISETLAPNAEVILSKIENSFYIIGTEKYKDRTRKTITISG